MWWISWKRVLRLIKDLIKRTKREQSAMIPAAAANPPTTLMAITPPGCSATLPANGMPCSCRCELSGLWQIVNWYWRKRSSIEEEYPSLTWWELRGIHLLPKLPAELPDRADDTGTDSLHRRIVIDSWSSFKLLDNDWNWISSWKLASRSQR